jgi:hypothetical protein
MVAHLRPGRSCDGDHAVERSDGSIGLTEIGEQSFVVIPM